MGLAPSNTKLQGPPIETRNDVNQWSLSNFRMSIPPAETKKPPIEDFLHGLYRCSRWLYAHCTGVGASKSLRATIGANISSHADREHLLLG